MTTARLLKVGFSIIIILKSSYRQTNLLHFDMGIGSGARSLPRGDREDKAAPLLCRLGLLAVGLIHRSFFILNCFLFTIICLKRNVSFGLRYRSFISTFLFYICNFITVYCLGLCSYVVKNILSIKIFKRIWFGS